MKARKYYLVVLAGLVIVALAAALRQKGIGHGDESQLSRQAPFCWSGAGAAFPLLTLPHMALPRPTSPLRIYSDCHPLLLPLNNIKILVGPTV